MGKIIGITLCFFALPVWANLFFLMPPTNLEKAGDIVFGLGYSRGEYQQSEGLEKRAYLPELRLDARFHARFTLSLYAFGVDTETRTQDPRQQGVSDFGAGDVLVGTWLRLNATGNQHFQWHASVQAKVPSSEAGVFGTDRTDLLLGLYAKRTGLRWFSQGVLRMDIVGRPNRTGQWDYLTLGVRGGIQTGKRWQILGEVWHRTRGSNNTTLVAVGTRFHLGEQWYGSAWAGEGDYHHYETNPDSRLKDQFSLSLSKRIESASLARWFGG